MSYKIAGAPGAWGVEDATNAFNPPWKKVLDEAAEAGYRGIELGPYGYLPQNVTVLQDELSKRHLQIVAGTIYDNLVSEDNFQKVIDKTHVTCQLLSNLPKAEGVEGQRFEPPYLVVIDEVNKERSPFAGLPNKAKRLSIRDWEIMVSHIKEISKVAQSYGIRSVLHPHAGGYIEFEDEIARLLADIPDEIGLCLDTGHLYYSGMNPTEWLLKYSDRLDYVHFKDINKAIYDDVISRQIGFFEACAEGVMCPIGEGIIDYESVKTALESINYKGWITIEQERDPRDSDSSLADVRKSLDYLLSKGY